MVMGDSVVKTQNIEPQAGLQHQGAALGVQAEADLPPFPCPSYLAPTSANIVPVINLWSVSQLHIPLPTPA